MPVRKKKDRFGVYYQWGTVGKRYYVYLYGKKRAMAKAKKQGQAVEIRRGKLLPATMGSLR